MDGGGDSSSGRRGSAGIGESGTGATGAGVSSHRNGGFCASEFASAKRIYEMALLAGVGGRGCSCSCIVLDCETENVEPSSGRTINARLPVRRDLDIPEA